MTRVRIDPDARHPAHDFLCQYVADPLIARQMVLAFGDLGRSDALAPGSLPACVPLTPGAEFSWSLAWGDSGYDYNVNAVFDYTCALHWDSLEISAEVERPLHTEQYGRRDITGWVDVALSGTASVERRGSVRWWKNRWDREVATHPTRLAVADRPVPVGEHGGLTFINASTHIGVEVKARITSVGELVRQVKGYREHHPDWRWVVVSPDLTEPIRRLLAGERIASFDPLVNGDEVDVEGLRAWFRRAQPILHPQACDLLRELGVRSKDRRPLALPLESDDDLGA